MEGFESKAYEPPFHKLCRLDTQISRKESQSVVSGYKLEGFVLLTVARSTLELFSTLGIENPDVPT